MMIYGIPLQSWEKSNVGGVHLNISDETGLKSAYGKILEISPSVLIQKMADSGMEWLVKR
jgi:hypothetical protein